MGELFNPGLLKGEDLMPKVKSPEPDGMDYQKYLDFFNTGLPTESPVLFGMHPNAEIGNLTTATSVVFDTVLLLFGGGGGGDDGEDKDPMESVKTTMYDLLERLPEKTEEVGLNRRADKIKWGETGPYIIVLLQECARMNVLLAEVGESLSDLDKALKGELNMTPMLEDLITALSIYQWPGRKIFSLPKWDKLAWPSLKKLYPQWGHMVERTEFFAQWVAADDIQTPYSVWISSLFNPTGFLTAIKQVCSRRTGLALDKMTTETHMIRQMDFKH